MNAPQNLIDVAKGIAIAQGLNPTLVLAVIEQESGWNVWACRYEPAFMARYVAPLFTNNKITATEAYTRSMSWGLMQILGQVAREQGFALPFLSALSDPTLGVTQGCIKLKHCLDRASGDERQALLSYNGGNRPAYADEVLARKAHYS